MTVISICLEPAVSVICGCITGPEDSVVPNTHFFGSLGDEHLGRALLVSGGSLVCLQLARQLCLWGLAAGMTEVIFLGLSIWRKLYSEKETEHRAFETRAQNWHLATSAVFGWPKWCSFTKPNPQQVGEWPAVLNGKKSKSQRKERYGSPVCTISPTLSISERCCKDSWIMIANVIKFSP